MVGWTEKRDWADERVFSCRWGKSKVVLLDPSAGTLDQRHIIFQETMGVLDGCIVDFP